MSDPETKGAPSKSALDFRWLTNARTGPVILALSAISMLLWTWGRYCHPFIDFGRELYVAWRLSAGEVLYRDIDYFNGPVSPYLNSLVFRVLGTSLLSLEVANLSWWTLLVLMAYRLYAAMSDRLAAFTAVLLFIALFSFIQLNDVGNYTFITPYSHEITHALICAFGMLTLLWSYLRKPAPALKQLVGCGAILGVMFLMKVEVTLAAGAALLTGVGLRLISTQAKPAQWLQTALTLIAAVLGPSVVAFALLRSNMPAHQALDGLLGSWKYLHDSRITHNPFYRRVLGTDDLRRNMTALFISVGCELLLLAPAAALAMLIRHRSPNETKWLCALLGAGYVVGLIWIFWDQANWAGAMRPLNIVGVASILTFLIAVARQRQNAPPRLILQIAFSIFATVLLSKTFFNIAIFHYGFALSGPAFALLVMSLVCWLPRWVHHRGGTGWVLRAAAIAALGSFCAKYLATYQIMYRSRPVQSIGSAADQFGVYHDAEAINLTLRFLDGLPAGQTVATIPQGAMINYLSRRTNPTGEVLLLPGEVAMFGEDRILDRFRQHPPDWLVDVQTDVAGFGFKGFGVDYAQSLVRYLKENYDLVPQSDPKGMHSPILLLKLDPGHRSMQHVARALVPNSFPATLPSPATSSPNH